MTVCSKPSLLNNLALRFTKFIIQHKIHHLTWILHLFVTINLFNTSFFPHDTFVIKMPSIPRLLTWRRHTKYSISLSWQNRKWQLTNHNQSVLVLFTSKEDYQLHLHPKCRWYTYVRTPSRSSPTPNVYVPKYQVHSAVK